MKKFRFLCLILIFPSLVQLFGNSQNIIPTSSPLFQRLSDIAVLEGYHMPSGNGPWSTEELALYHSTYNSSLSNPHTYRIKETLRSSSIELLNTQFSINPLITTNIEFYAHTSQHAAFDEDEEWIIDYSDRKPLVNIPLEFLIGNNFYGYMEITARNNRFYYGTESTKPFFSEPFSTNLIFDESLMNIDASFPWRGFLSTGGKNWNIQIGRDRLDWGHGVTGNLLLSDHLDYHEFGKLSLFGEKGKFTFVMASFDPLDTGDYALSYLIAHSFEYSPHPKLLLGVTEAMKYGGDTFNLKYLNPFMFFHNYYIPDNSNSFLTIDANYTPIPGFNIYSQLAIDEITAPGEHAQSADGNPPAYGIIAGVRHVMLRNKTLFRNTLEFAYTYPFLYLRDYKVHPPVNFIVGHGQFTRDEGVLVDTDFLGYEYGNDALVADFKTEVVLPSNTTLTGEVFYMAHGTHDQDTEWETTPLANQAVTPTEYEHTSTASGEKNAVEHTFALTGAVQRPVNDWLSGSITCSNIFILNSGNIKTEGFVHDMQLVMSLTATY